MNCPMFWCSQPSFFSQCLGDRGTTANGGWAPRADLGIMPFGHKNGCHAVFRTDHHVSQAAVPRSQVPPNRDPGGTHLLIGSNGSSSLGEVQMELLLAWAPAAPAARTQFRWYVLNKCCQGDDFSGSYMVISPLQGLAEYGLGSSNLRWASKVNWIHLAEKANDPNWWWHHSGYIYIYTYWKFQTYFGAHDGPCFTLSPLH